MYRKVFNNLFVFLAVFVVISVTADVYYYNKVVVKDNPASNGQICYSDFRVFWFAAYDVYNHVLRDPLYPASPHFRPLWFLDPVVRGRVKAYVDAGDPHIVYKKTSEFYHFRYSPFVAFAMMPLGKTFPPARALAIWYIILNAFFLSALLAMASVFEGSTSRAHGLRYPALWMIFIMSLRFYLNNIALGQTDILAAFVLVLFLLAYARDRQAICGILFAVLLQTKPFFFPVLLYFLFTRKVRIVLWAALGFLCMLAIPSYMLGFEKTAALTQDWFAIMRSSVPSQVLNPKNQSLAYFTGSLLLKIPGLERLTKSPQGLIYSISLAMTIAAYMALALMRGKIQARDEKNFRYLEVSILIVSSLLFSPISWVSHFIALVVPMGIVLYFISGAEKKKGLYALVSGFFILSLAAGTDLTKFIPYINKAPIPNVALGTVCLAIAAIYAYRETAAAR